jgi:hypothetical protein
VAKEPKKYTFFEEPTEEPTVEPTTEKNVNNVTGEPTGEPTVEPTSSGESNKPRGPTKQLREDFEAYKTEMQTRLASIESMLKQIPPQLPSTPPRPLREEMKEEIILMYSNWIIQQDPKRAPATIRNAITKKYRRPAEDYVRGFQTFLESPEFATFMKAREAQKKQ